MDFAAIRAGTNETLRRFDRDAPDVLPLLSEGDVAWIRPVDQIDSRCGALAGVLDLVHDGDVEQIARIGKDRGWDRWLADEERSLLRHKTGEATLDGDALEKVELHAKWADEPLEALLWCLGVIDDLPPDRMADGKRTFDRYVDTHVDDLEVRPHEELARMLDLYYCLDWWGVEGSLGNEGLPEAISWGSTRERRHALEWVLTDEDWDEISLDT